MLVSARFFLRDHPAVANSTRICALYRLPLYHRPTTFRLRLSNTRLKVAPCLTFRLSFTVASRRTGKTGVQFVAWTQQILSCGLRKSLSISLKL